MTRRLQHTLGLLVLGIALSIRPASAAVSILLADNESVVVAAESGELQLWRKHATSPAWTVSLHGESVGARSRIAALAVWPNGDITAIERYGQVVRVSADGVVLARKQPVLARVQLNVEFDQVDWEHWTQQMESFGHTSAAVLDLGNRIMYIAEDDWNVMFKVRLDDFFAQKGDVVYLANGFQFFFADRNLTVWSRLDDVPFSNTLAVPMAHDERITALAVCPEQTVIGTDTGAVYFLPTHGDWSADSLARQVGDESYEVRSILDAGCIGSDMAYTVSFEAGNGQIQLWDLKRRIATSSVGFETQGHFFMAFSAVPSADGRQLLSLGRGDVRLWDITDGKLSFVSYKALGGFRGFGEGGHPYAAVALPTGGFIVWDGVRLRQLSSDGQKLTRYAGTEP